MQLAVMYLVYDTGYHVWLVVVHRARDAINLILYNTGYPCSYFLQVTVDSYQQEYCMPVANVQAFMCLVNYCRTSYIYWFLYERDHHALVCNDSPIIKSVRIFHWECFPQGTEGLLIHSIVCYHII